MAKKLAICLDLDGTLVVSEVAHVKAFQEAFTKNGYPSKSEKEITAMFGIPAKQIVNKFFPKANPRDITKIINDPEIGKPMRFDRKGAREVYVPPFRLSYNYDKEQEILYLLEVYHKDEQ